MNNTYAIINAILSLTFSVLMSFQAIGQRPPIICDLDTNFYFELTVFVQQYQDSLGKVHTDSYSMATALDNFRLNESDATRLEVCDPYQLEYDQKNDRLFILQHVWNEELQKLDTLKLGVSKERFVALRVKALNYSESAVNLNKVKELHAFELPAVAALFVEGSGRASELRITKWKVIKNRQQIALICIRSPYLSPKLLQNLKKFKGLVYLTIGKECN